MRLLLFILGVFVLSSALKNLLMRKTAPGASIKMAKAAAVVRSAAMQHSNNAWLTGLGVAPVDPVRTRRRQNHVRQPGFRGGCEPLRLLTAAVDGCAASAASGASARAVVYCAASATLPRSTARPLGKL